MQVGTAQLRRTLFHTLSLSKLGVENPPAHTVYTAPGMLLLDEVGGAFLLNADRAE